MNYKTPWNKLVVCFHCGENWVELGEADHLCMAALFDWMEGLDGQHRPRDFGEIAQLMEQLELA